VSIVHISGRIGRDAEVRTVGDNKVANFSVAENIGFGDKKTTQWWSCALWGTRGEKLAQYLTKGSAVTVCGEVSVREYTSKDGTAKWELTCRVLDVALQGGGESRDADAPQTLAEKSRGKAAADDKGEFDDDIPFN
jgi:single-strand DNA-binding protein